MFDALSSSLQRVFKKLRGYGKLSERNVQEAMREVRVALLEADVHYEVVRDFTARVREQCMGEAVLDSITPGQQVVKRVHEALVDLLGRTRRDPDLSVRPSTVMLLGLHGSGKTTTAAKLARHWKKGGRNVLLVAADIRRPAAVEQLSILAGQVGCEVVTPQAGERVPAIGRRALAAARERAADVVVFDTGGRFQIDEELVAELKDLHEAVEPRNVILVVDAAIGQESVNVAQSFHKELGLTGIIMTKLDGDARGGAALSMHAVTGCPIVMVGVGEKLAELEPFHPDRMASRILGMGDVVGLVEKAQEAIDLKDMAELEKRLRKDSFDLDDFLKQIRQMRKAFGFDSLLEMLPIGNEARAAIRGRGGEDMTRFAKQAEAILSSMTRKERRRPKLIDGSRRRRIAAGSGTEVSDVNELLRRFDQARKMAKRIGKLSKRMPGGLLP
ncbi:MAG: signal recognition particle protein [Kiritimatiellae bacterium]|nr:signal recognition particle protein [Kiritimatiellia bacterium]